MLKLTVKIRSSGKLRRSEIFVGRGVSSWYNKENDTILAVLLLFFCNNADKIPTLIEL
ncbi:hypothetical protein [Cyclobacterium marinum]|uniref:hypothetical protein n=1 Tax=Cyclobacterium marinum TaxID=104 RepID=UPI001658E719|nr:hypothetical protein [Cyclobacterium marinum]MBI0398665.1 hypothetical protein [Cyclobacterium marinum]